MVKIRMLCPDRAKNSIQSCTTGENRIHGNHCTGYQLMGSGCEVRD